jgi:flagella basal body P-ring formation protein FlgA
MVLKLLFLLFFIYSFGFSNQLKEFYYLDSTKIHISDIIEDVEDDIHLYDIPINKHILRIKSSLLIKMLEKNGYDGFNSKHNYTTFKIKSPVDTSKIENELIKYYKKNYDDIDIEYVNVEPRGYIDKMPDDYIVSIRSRNYLYNNSILSIKTLKNQKIFFDYTIKATLPVYITKQNIKKDTPLSALNTIKKSIILDKFKDKPVQNITKNQLQTKRNTKKNHLLTYRDVEELSLIQKGATVNVVFVNSGFNISFTARALQEGRLGQVITVQKSNGKRFKVKVISKNKAEMQ